MNIVAYFSFIGIRPGDELLLIDNNKLITELVYYATNLIFK